MEKSICAPAFPEVHDESCDALLESIHGCCAGHKFYDIKTVAADPGLQSKVLRRLQRQIAALQSRHDDLKEYFAQKAREQT